MSPRYANMFDPSVPIRFVTAAASGLPSAPSPAAVKMNGRPGAGVVPVAGVHVPVLCGAVVTPFANVSGMSAAVVSKPSRISRCAFSVYAPSTNRCVGSENAYGDVKSVSRYSDPRSKIARWIPGEVPVELVVTETGAAPVTVAPAAGAAMQIVAVYPPAAGLEVAQAAAEAASGTRRA